MQNKILLILFIFLGYSCGQGDSKNELDLMQYGLPIKLKAPADAEVKTEDLGFMQDVTLKKGEDYYIQILAGTAIKLDEKEIIKEKLEEVKNGPFFNRMIREEDHGFIFEKKIDEKNINYDFRYVRIQGDKEYIFQTGLIGTFSLEDVEKMYKSVQ